MFLEARILMQIWYWSLLVLEPSSSERVYHIFKILIVIADFELILPAGDHVAHLSECMRSVTALRNCIVGLE